MIEVYFSPRKGTITLRSQDAERLWTEGFYGTRQPYPALSAPETLHLLKRGLIRVMVVEVDYRVREESLSVVQFSEAATALNPRFPKLHHLYERLKQAKGVQAVRSGINYGCEYLVYAESPEVAHASLAVLLYEEGGLGWRQLLGLNRAVSGAKKRLILALPNGKLVEMTRWQPEEVLAGRTPSAAKRERRLQATEDLATDLTSMKIS